MEELKSNLEKNNLLQSQLTRIQSLIDIIYLVNVTWLYVFSLIYPLFGIIFGVIISQGSISQYGQKIGRTCLILGVVNLVLLIISVVIFIALGGVLSKLIPYSI
ncbi:MAG: hypothetical protein N2201_06935 [candidate division WOR-3 bacterium]|nr:hypothetical protein [candidate division WOR-3 bacterium]